MLIYCFLRSRVFPSEKLTVNGIIYAKQSIVGKRSTGSLAIAGNTGSTDGGTVELYSATDNKEVRVIGNAIRFYDYDAANLNWDENMNINSDGKVGIGTEYPWGTLHIATKDNDLTSVALQITNLSGANVFTVRDNGQIGINWDFTGAKPSNTDYKLAVNGKIYAQGETLRLSQNWPDYVFKSNYKLRSLKELENFILKFGHLPNIPTASKVETDGIDVEAINISLVQTVEELTLYIIQIQKEIEELKIQSHEK